MAGSASWERDVVDTLASESGGGGYAVQQKKKNRIECDSDNSFWCPNKIKFTETSFCYVLTQLQQIRLSKGILLSEQLIFYSVLRICLLIRRNVLKHGPIYLWAERPQTNLKCQQPKNKYWKGCAEIFQSGLLATWGHWLPDKFARRLLGAIATPGQAEERWGNYWTRVV